MRSQPLPSIASIQLERVGLTAGVGSHYLLRDVSFEIARGDRIALVGPSGSGKTSLLRLLNRLTDPTEGTIYLNGQNLKQIPVAQLRQQVTLVLQESKLLGMTVQDALSYPLRLRAMGSVTLQQHIGEWMERLHLPTAWMERSELQLSVGQRQLVAIARALVCQPQVLLLDEPTSALDGGRATHVLKTILEFAQANQTTILMANHQLKAAQQLCTRIIYLQQGRLLQDRPAPEVDWQTLEAALVQAEAEDAEEW